MTDWTEIIITVAVQEIGLAGDIAHMVVPYGIYIEDYTDLEEGAWEIAHIDLIDEALLEKDRSVGVVHIYLPAEEGASPAEAVAYLTERYAAEGIAHQIETRLCKNADWENNWKAYFHPLPVGQRLLIQPAWEPPADPQGRAVLLLEPGLAFGSGSHATTRLCMEALERHVTLGCAVLDIGCGSGILALAALLLGAERALGVDIDPMAVENARENAARNGFACDPARDSLRFLCGNLTDAITGQYDVVVSNIVADAIIALSTQVRPFLKPGGVWLSSGIIDTRAEDVLQSLAQAGFTILSRAEEDGWVCLAAQAG